MKAPRGTHDIMPGEIHAWQKAEAIIREHCAQYGYTEIRTPVFEHTEVFARGVGDTTDIVQKEMYTFTDRSDRSMTLRPENTAGVVRAFLEHRLYNEPLPAKLYYLSAPMFRYEAPQSGRYRQFYQFGIEAFGAGEPSCDAEVITFAWRLLNKMGIHNLSLEINSIGCPKCRPAFSEKLKAHFHAHEDTLCETCGNRLEKNPLRIFDCKSPVCQEVVKDAPVMLDHLCQECAVHFASVKKYLDLMQLPYIVNPRIVRGLDYYSKTVFELISRDIGAQGAVCAGGRYDGLVSMMGGPPTPGVGFAFGLERLLLVMQAAGTLWEKEPACQAYVMATPDESCRMAAFTLTQALRRGGAKVDLDHAGRSLKAQMKYAGKLSVPFGLIIGENELERGVVKLRDMNGGTQTEMSLSDTDGILATLTKGGQ
ncbi:MAG: histidine--tRNA ligase [Christensenellales bacterium]